MVLECKAQAALSIVLGTFALIGIAESAVAEQPSQEQLSAIRSACQSDYRAHCASVPTGGAAALECLRKNVASLSPPCQQAVNAVGASAPASSSASAPANTPTQTPPVRTESSTAAPTAAGTPTESSATSPSPSAAPNPAAPPAAARGTASERPSKAQAAAIKTACRSDFPTHCPGVRPGGTTAWSCLQANAASLSPPCQQAVYAVANPAPAKKNETGIVKPEPTLMPSPSPTMRSVSPREALYVLRTSCAGDFRAFCSNMPLGGGRAIACLGDHAASLSPRCQRALGLPHGQAKVRTNR